MRSAYISLSFLFIFFSAAIAFGQTQDRIPPKLTNYDEVKSWVEEEEGIEGIVHLRLKIDTEGNVLQYVTPEDKADFTVDRTIKSISRMKFTPGTVNGTPETTWAAVRFIFDSPKKD